MRIRRLLGRAVLTTVLLVLVLVPTPAQARNYYWNYVTRGGVNASGLVSNAIKVQGSYPGATIRVDRCGTSSLATLYVSASGAVNPVNPFTASTTGFFSFWTDQSCVKLTFSGGGLPSTVTIDNVLTSASGSSPFISVGAVCDGTTLETAVIQAALDIAGPHTSVLPAGQCVTGPLTINQSRVNLIGAGPVATQLRFVPTANNQVQLSYISSPSGAVIGQNELGNLGITSSDTTRAKIAVRLTDVSEFYMHDVQIGPNGGWNGTTGGTTYGLQIRGRDLSRVERFEISCTDGVPVRVERNPNVALGGLEDLDVWHFSDFHIVASTGHWGFEFEDGAQPTDVVIENGDFGNGAGAFRYVNTLSPSVASGLTLRGFRGETSSNGAYIYIDAGTSFSAYRSIVMDRLTIGQGTAQKGIFLRHATNVTISNVYAVTAAGVASLDVDAVIGLKLLNNFWRGTSVMTMGANMARLLAITRSFDTLAPGYLEENWEDISVNANVAGGAVVFLGGPLGGTSGLNCYAMSGSLANGAQQLIPLPGASMAYIQVLAVGATKSSVGSAGVTNLAPGNPLTLTSVVGAGNIFAVGNVAGKFSVFDAGSGITTTNLFNQSGETMTYTVMVEWK